MKYSLLTLATVVVAMSHGRDDHRVVIERYANGFMRREAEYRGAVQDGTTWGWFENGARAYEYRYVNGVSEGVQEQWFPDGRIYARFHHRAGHEVGQQQMWNADGTIRSNYVIRDGKRYGLLGAIGCTGRGTADSAAAR